MSSVDACSSGQAWEVPQLTVECFRMVYSMGLEAEGIFRISPQMSVVQEVKNAFAAQDPANKGRLARRLTSRKNVSDEPKKYDTITSITQDPHIAAHVLKDFLRKLEVPLFPVAVNQTLIAAVKEKDFATKIKSYKEVLANSLSPSCLRVLIGIGFICQNVVKHTAENKMSYQALGVVFGPCLIRLDPMHMIEMWDSRIAEELFGNFGAIVEDISASELAIVAEIIAVPEVKFTKDPPMTAKVKMLNKADMGEGGGAVDLQINVTFIGDETPHKFDLFCACAAKQAPSDPVRAKMRKAYVRPLDSLAMLDSGTKVGVRLSYVFDWLAPPSPTPLPIPGGGPGGAGRGGPPSVPPRAPSPNPPGAPPALPSAPPSAALPPPLVPGAGKLPPQQPGPPRPLPPPPTAQPAGPPPLTSSQSVPVTRKEKKETPKQDYEQILKDSNVIVLPFSIAKPKTLEDVTEKWIPALQKLQITAPVMIVGCEKEKRDQEGVEGLVSIEQAKEIPETFAGVEKYVEISTVTYKGFRSLADSGLDAFLLDYHSKQQKRRVTEVKTPSTAAVAGNMAAIAAQGPPPSHSNSSSSLGSSSSQTSLSSSAGGGRGGGGKKGKGGKDENCLIM